MSKPLGIGNPPRNINWPEPKEEQISEYEKHLEKTIEMWQEKYRKLEEEYRLKVSEKYSAMKEIKELESENESLKEENKDLNSMLIIAYVDNESLKGKVKELEESNNRANWIIDQLKNEKDGALSIRCEECGGLGYKSFPGTTIENQKCWTCDGRGYKIIY